MGASDLGKELPNTSESGVTIAPIDQAGFAIDTRRSASESRIKAMRMFHQAYGLINRTSSETIQCAEPHWQCGAQGSTTQALPESPCCRKPRTILDIQPSIVEGKKACANEKPTSLCTLC